MSPTKVSVTEFLAPGQVLCLFVDRLRPEFVSLPLLTFELPVLFHQFTDRHSWRLRGSKRRSKNA